MSCMLLLRPTGVLEAGRLGGLDGPARPAGPTYLLRLEVDMSSWHMRISGGGLKRLELRRDVVSPPKFKFASAGPDADRNQGPLYIPLS